MNVKTLIKYRLNQLDSNGNTIESYFNIIHSEKNQLFCETNDIKITYGECELYSKKMGHFFTNELKDLPKHSYVGLMMENRLEFITCFYGLLMAGYKPMLLNMKLSDELNEQIVKRLDIKYLVCDKEYTLSPIKINVSSIDYSMLEYRDTEFVWEDEMAISTSATSLNIKICVYDGVSISEQIKNMIAIYNTNPIIAKGYKDQVKHLAFLPFYHIFGLMAEYFWFTLINASFVFLTDFSSETILKTIRDYNVTHIFAVPILWNAVYKSIAKQVESKDKVTRDNFYRAINISNSLQSANQSLGNLFARNTFKSVRSKVFGDTPTFLVTGGSDIPEETLKLINGLGYHLFNGYGMSEIGITSVELSSKASDRNLGSIGKPFSQVEYKISDDGHLLVKSKGICKKIITKDSEYLVDKEEYFDTGDFAKEVKGRYYLYGRNDDVVLTENGEKINPTLIEKMLNIKYIERMSVLGINVDNKECLSLLIEIDKNFDQDKISLIVNSVVENLNLLKDLNYNIEKVFYTYDRIISPSMIKISRKSIIRWINTGEIKIYPLNDLKAVKEDDLTEEQIEISLFVKKAFSETLGIDIDNIGLESHFTYDLGGTSLDYLTLISKLSEKYNLDYNIDESNYTVIEFTNYIISNKQ